MIAKIGLATASAILTVAGLLAANWIVGTRAAAPMFPLLFPPLSRINVETSEFRFQVRINRLGFRDRDFTLEKPPGRFRILAVGDSFTYGWGVDVEDSWPKLLERELRTRGFEVDVANLGKPGADPADYVRMISDGAQILAPDLVLVGILQVHDLDQLLDDDTPGAAPVPHRRVLALFGNLRFAAPPLITAGEFREQWQKQARMLLAGLDAEERQRYREIDAKRRRAFLSGDLNPSLLRVVVRGRDVGAILTEHSELLVSRLATLLSAAADECRTQGCRLLALSIPSREADVIISAPLIAEAAGLAGVMSVEATHGGADLYFPLDGHFTPEGHRRFVQDITPGIIASLTGS